MTFQQSAQRVTKLTEDWELPQCVVATPPDVTTVTLPDGNTITDSPQKSGNSMVLSYNGTPIHQCYFVSPQQFFVPPQQFFAPPPHCFSPHCFSPHYQAQHEDLMPQPDFLQLP